MVKGKRFLSILATAVILAMLIAVIPANLCFAETGDEDIDVSPSSGWIGDDIDVDGSDFEDGEIIYFYFSSDSGGSDGENIDTLDAYEFLDDDTADSSGDVSISFEVPDELTEGDDADEDVEEGTYYVYAVYEENDEIWAKDSFSVEEDGGTGDESISVTPTSVEIDDYVEIEGRHFEDDATVWFYFSKESASVGEEIDSDVENYEKVEAADASSSGYVTGHFDVPEVLNDGEDDEDVVGGTYYVYATYEDDDEIVAKDNITIIATELSISPTKGTVGTEVEITGSGFDDNRSITIKFGGSTVEISEGDDETSSSGTFTSSILVPEIAKGSYSITVTVGSDTATVEDKFTVEPDIEIDPEDGGVNDRVIVTGTGFAQNDDISITFDGVTVTTGETNSYGSFDAPFNVPEVSPGTYKVEADTAEASFTISTSVSISPTTTLTSPGYVGDEVTISGTGFKANSEITITYESTPVVVATVDSESDGSFEATFEVPPSTAGEHTIKASDGTSSALASFVMESTPPETPQPQRPYMEGKAGSKAYFDWDDVVTDIDGVDEKSTPITYDLQVATDENFTHKLVNKTGLTTSEYTLTADEALESTSDETPYYYWRVRAVDAASNASDWTGTGIFTVGFTFNFPGLSGWVLYVLIGVGAVVLFFIGLWVGRRSGGGDYY
jgi:hypothetical protein